MGSCSSLPINLLLGSCLLLQAEHSQLPARLDMLGKSKRESLTGILLCPSTIIKHLGYTRYYTKY